MGMTPINTRATAAAAAESPIAAPTLAVQLRFQQQVLGRFAEWDDDPGHHAAQGPEHAPHRHLLLYAQYDRDTHEHAITAGRDGIDQQPGPLPGRRQSRRALDAEHMPLDQAECIIGRPRRRLGISSRSDRM